MNALALLLLVTVGAAEQSYGPYARPARHGNHSIAAARGGVLLAWSENDASGRARVHVALLDSSAHLISPITAIPALQPDRDAILPAVATDGASFLVVWEESALLKQTVGIAVDAHGLPAGTPAAIGYDSPLTATPSESLHAIWTGSEYAVRTREGHGWSVRPGTMLAQWLAAPVPDAIASDGTFGRTSIQAVSWNPGWPPGTGPFFYYVGFSAGPLRWSHYFGATIPGTPSIAAAGRDFVVAWTVRDALYYRRSEGTLYSLTADVDEWSRTDVACTGVRCVIAYTTRTGDVHAVAFHPAQAAEREHFTVASSARDEREPAVAILNHSRALVTYRSSGSDGERLAGRILFFNAPKQRAVR